MTLPAQIKTAKRLIPIIISSILCVSGLALILYGSTQPATIVLLSRISRTYQGEISIFTLLGLVFLPMSLFFLLFWVFTLPKKPKTETKL